MDGCLVLIPKCLKCDSLIVETKSLTVHKGSIMNSLSQSGPTTDWIGGSAPTRPSLESPSDLSISKSSSLEGEEADKFLFSLKVSGSF